VQVNARKRRKARAGGRKRKGVLLKSLPEDVGRHGHWEAAETCASRLAWAPIDPERTEKEHANENVKGKKERRRKKVKNIQSDDPKNERQFYGRESRENSTAVCWSIILLGFSFLVACEG
jgi:hypothetical protein